MPSRHILAYLLTLYRDCHICFTGRRLINDSCAAVLHWLWSRDDERPTPVSDSKLHPRQLPCHTEVYAILGHQDPAVLLEGLLCPESHCAAEGEGGYCELCPLQVATVILTVLRGVQVRRAESAEEWRNHCRQLDWSLCGWWSGTGAPWAVVPGGHCGLQQQVSSVHYTLWAIKNVPPLYFGTKLPCFLVDFYFVPTEAGMNALQRSYKIYNFTLTVSPRCLIKLKPHRTSRFEVNHSSILLLSSKNECCELSEA